MNNESTPKITQPCPAYRDTAFVISNILVWLSGSFGMYWLTDTALLNITVSAAYLAVNILFFWGIFSRGVCPNCAYHYPGLSREEYLARFKERFIKALNFWYKAWLLIGWVWPIGAMTAAYVISRKPVLLASLIGFLLISFGIFLPILRLRVCAHCKANELGICPFFPPAQAEV